MVLGRSFGGFVAQQYAAAYPQHPAGLILMATSARYPDTEQVVAHDLRTGIALILAGLAAEGETTVTPGYPIDRGHSTIAQRFSALGADIAAIPADAS